MLYFLKVWYKLIYNNFRRFGATEEIPQLLLAMTS
jgi:hypothetical protein